MSITLKEKDNGYADGFSKFLKDASVNETGWLRSVREEGIAKFSELGFPTPRDEDWRFTNVAPIARAEFELTRNGYVTPSAGDIRKVYVRG